MKKSLNLLNKIVLLILTVLFLLCAGGGVITAFAVGETQCEEK